MNQKTIEHIALYSLVLVGTLVVGVLARQFVLSKGADDFSSSVAFFATVIVLMAIYASLQTTFNQFLLPRIEAFLLRFSDFQTMKNYNDTVSAQEALTIEDSNQATPNVIDPAPTAEETISELSEYEVMRTNAIAKQNHAIQTKLEKVISYTKQTMVVISQACSAVWIIGFLTSRRATLRLQPRYMHWDGPIVRSILALGVSPFIMASTESLIGFVLNSSLKAYGDIYISALAIMQSAMLFVSVPLTGFAQGFVPVASYNYGHGNRERLKSCFRIVLLTMFTFNLVLIVLMLCFPHLVAAAFTDDGRLIATVERVMPLFLSGMSIFGLQRACQNTFVALGAARISVFIALLRKVFLLVPLALLLPHFWGMKGVFLAESISDATAAICCTLIFAYQFPRILAHMKAPKAA